MFTLARLYSMIYGVTKDRLGINLPGLGFLLRRLHQDRIIQVDGRAFWLNHKVSQCYGRLISGSWNEPETHRFINFVFDHLSGSGLFIDVGANIGELAVDITGHRNVEFTQAYEPITECATAIRNSMKLNGYTNYSVIESACGHSPGFADFHVSGDISNSSILHSSLAANKLSIPVTTLDDTILKGYEFLVLLIDVEGHEVDVLRGAQRLINSYKPVIIFEYNYVSKQYFDLEQIRDVLGPDYTIWRLRDDGRLDQNLERAWNCVALPASSAIADSIQTLLLTK